MWKLYFSPAGAIHRLHYLYGLIVSTGLLAIGYIFAGLPLIKLVSMPHHPRIAQYAPKLAIVLYAICFIFVLLSTWVNICVHLKRLYDLRMPRFLVIIPYFYVMSQKYIPNSIQNTLMIILVTVYIMCLLFWPSRRDGAESVEILNI